MNNLIDLNDELKSARHYQAVSLCFVIKAAIYSRCFTGIKKGLPCGING